ncbi:hypothetical protein [Microbacterium sp. gxy059]|uniref:hypothetical protein n=1 Tax=Microbacterium sp. gxy059 TaxID=2957199 RepID=UPI003D99C17B
MLSAATLPGTILGAALVAAMSAILVLVLVRRRQPAAGPLLAAGMLAALALLAAAALPFAVPLPLSAPLAALAAAAAVLGGDPVTRRVLETTADGRVQGGAHGGILLRSPAGRAGEAPAEVMRGGTTIGYLERAAVALAIIAGFPEAIALVVALKGIGRFSELVSPEARGRFIVGTLASLVWAAVVAGAARLALG